MSRAIIITPNIGWAIYNCDAVALLAYQKEALLHVKTGFMHPQKKAHSMPDEAFMKAKTTQNGAALALQALVSVETRRKGTLMHFRCYTTTLWTSHSHFFALFGHDQPLYTRVRRRVRSTFRGQKGRKSAIFSTYICILCRFINKSWRSHADIFLLEMCILLYISTFLTLANHVSH